MWIAVTAAVLLLFVVGVRRWIHHAQIELAPVLIVPGADAQSVVDPPPAAIAARMILDVREVVQRPDRPRLAVLTFDDGPFPVDTPALGAVLRSLRVPADFFFIGEDARRQPAIARRSADAGIEIGNHTLTHPEMPTLPYEAQRGEIANGAAAIRISTGEGVTYFRPPHGNFDVDTVKAAQEAGETVALWDIDPGDWRALTADQIVALALAQARAPAIILLHNGKEETIEALPRIVAAYRKAGFEFVTMSQLQRRVPLEEINDPMRVQL